MTSTGTLRRRLLQAAAFIGAAFACAAPAAAQVVYSPDEEALARTGMFARDQNVGVMDRPRPEYAPLGIDLGGFTLQPELDTSLEYNNNIFATPNDQASDEIFHISPVFTATSNWNTNQLQIYGRGSFNEYAEHSSESVQNGALGGTYRLDVANDLGVAVGASIVHDSISRTSPNSPTQAQAPVEFNLATAYAVGTVQFTRVRLSAKAEYQDFAYDNAVSNTGVGIYERGNDEGIVTGTFRAEYALLPGASVFTNLVLNHQDNTNVALGQISRTGSGYEATVGANFDLTHLIRGEVFLGYLDQSFDDSRYKQISGVSLRGYVQYYPTQLLTITLSGTRVPVDSFIIGEGGYLDSNVTGQADYELLRNLLITAKVTYENDYYNTIGRQDNWNIESLTATYLMNRRIALNLTYAHTQDASNGLLAGYSFDISSITAGVTLKY